MYENIILFSCSDFGTCTVSTTLARQHHHNRQRASTYIANQYNNIYNKKYQHLRKQKSMGVELQRQHGMAALQQH